MAEANYAFIKDGSVVNIVIFDEPTQELLDIFIAEHNIDQIIPCGDNQKAVMGATYSNEIFIGPKPYPSWILNEDYDWEPPTPNPSVFTGVPATTELYNWDEDTVSWIRIPYSE